MGSIHHKHIHRILRKHHPQAVKKAQKIFAFKYPKIMLLVGLIILSYFIFSRQDVSALIKSFNGLGNIGILISGILISFGFTAPFGIGILLEISVENIWIASLIGGFGGLIADLFIFKMIKFSFLDEFKELEKTPAIKKIETIVKNNKHVLIRHYLLYIFAGIMIASPLPDEIGVSMLAGLTTIKPTRLVIISFLLHSLAMYLVLYFI